MDKYFNTYREKISLRGLTDHTLTSYSTYIRSYLDYLSDVLHKMPEEVSREELRDYIRWLQKSRSLSDHNTESLLIETKALVMQNEKGNTKSMCEDGWNTLDLQI